MATKPGPAVAVAALAALFLLRKKGGGEGAAVDKDALDNAEDGTEVEDDTPNKPASPSGGGKKVPKGTGAGGGSWDPGKIGPTTFWISPDCRNVIEGPEWYDKVLVPAMLKVFQDLNTRFEKSVELGWDGGSFMPDLYSVLSVALGFRKLTPASKTPFEGRTFVDTDFASKPPGSCVMAAPMFDVGYEGATYKAGGNGIAAESQAAFNEALEEYFGKFPQMAMWLYSLQERMVQDDRLPETARSQSAFFNLSFLTKNRTGADGNPPERAPDLSIFDLFSLAKINEWWEAALAFMAKYQASHPKAISEYKSFVQDWYNQATEAGKKLPVSLSQSPESAAGITTPANTGILIGRVVSKTEGAVGLPQPISNAGISVDGKSYSTDNQGYFEAMLPAGWHPLSITVGPAESEAYVTIEAGQTATYDFQSPL